MILYTDVLVSIIIPIYNTEPYLRRCIDSVRKQTHDKLEIIIVNDESSDNSAELCNQIKEEDNRITVIHQKHCGAGGARNRGIDIASGEWICFIDSDDIVSERFVELLLQAVLDNDCLTAQCKHDRGINKKIEESIFQPKILTMDWRSFLFLCMSDPELSGLGLCFNICHRSLFFELRFPDLKHSEDTAIISMFYYAARHKKIAVVDHSLYHHYLRNDSTTKSTTTLARLDRCHANKQMILYWEEKKEYELFEIYWQNYFSIIIEEYLNLSRGLPQLSEKYRHLREEILLYKDRAKSMCHTELTIKVGAKELWESFSDSNKRFIMYGYGDMGTRALEWIMYFKLDLIEIWDKRATEGENIDGIPFRQAHPEQNEDITIMIAIADPYLAFVVQNTLRQLGYKNFVHWHTFDAALKYAKYKRFLPFLLEDKT